MTKRQRDREVDDSANSVIVKGFHQNISVRALREFFGQYGKVEY